MQYAESICSVCGCPGGHIKPPTEHTSDPLLVGTVLRYNNSNHYRQTFGQYLDGEGEWRHAQLLDLFENIDGVYCDVRTDDNLSLHLPIAHFRLWLGPETPNPLRG